MLAKMKAVKSVDGRAQVVEVSTPDVSGESDTRDIVVKVAATAVNRADLMQVAGKYPPPPGASDVIGLEASGTVVQKASGCTSDLQIGTRVCALLTGGGYGEFVRVDERLVRDLPPGMNFAQGVAITEVWLTAFQLLSLVANVSSRDSVLIHAGASGVGTAAIQLLRKVFGVTNIIVTAGSDAKIEFCKSLGASAGFNYKQIPDWAERVVEITGGKGVDVVLDCIGFPYVEQNLKAIAIDGRWVLFGLMGGVAPAPPMLREVLIKRIQLLGSTLRMRSEDYKCSLIKSFQEATDALFQRGDLQPILDKQSYRGLESAPLALEYLKSNQSMGKVVIEL